MKNSTKDKVQGSAHETKGAGKEKIGDVVKNLDLEAEGAKEKAAGKVQKKLGQVEKATGK